MEHDAALGGTTTGIIASQVKQMRTRRGWSAQQLADAMKATGVPWERMVVTKFETGRRQSLTVEELLALAFVLEVAPVHLLVPIDADGEYPVTPTVSAATDRVRAWIRGQLPIPGMDPRVFYSNVPPGEFGSYTARTYTRKDGSHVLEIEHGLGTEVLESNQEQ